MAVAISHTASFEYTSVDTDHDEAGVAIGSASADRLVFVCAAVPASPQADDINTVSIGGVSAARARRDSFAVSALAGGVGIEIWWALVPTGNTATISFAHDAGVANAKFSVYSVTGADTTSPVFDSEFASRSDALTNAVSVSVDVPSNGGAIGLATGDFSGTSVSVAWTYLSEDLDNDLDLGGAFQGFSTASISGAGASSAQAVTATFTEVGGLGIVDRGLTVVTLTAVAATADADASSAGAGAAAGSARASASVASSAAGTGIASGAGRSVASASGFAAGAATLAAEGEGLSESAAGFASGSGNLTAVSAVIAAAAGFAAGAGGAAGDTPVIVVPVVTYPPIGGGGGFGPAGYRPDKQRFRTRKDKSHPKVITVRIGNWPEDPQIILERREQAERDEFYQSFPDAPFEETVESGDDEEAILLAILAIAA